MELKIEIKIKVGKEKQVVLSGDEAKELYLKLNEIYAKEKEYVSYPYIPWYQPITWATDTLTVSSFVSS